PTAAPPTSSLSLHDALPILAVWNFDTAPWRARPTFCMDLRITYEDGTTSVVKTDGDWKTSAGPVVFNSIYTAEHYDARLEQPGRSEEHTSELQSRENLVCRL